MQIWYTARNKFDKNHSEDDFWIDYINWARLSQLKEVVGLDCSLSDLVFEVDTEDESTYDHLITDDMYSTELFNSLDYVLNKARNTEVFNLLAVLKNPLADCSVLAMEDFQFLGYELLDEFYEHSALTNCGGFDETFLPSELNEYGLLNSYDRTVEVQKNLITNNPEEDHAYCNIFGIWRHNTIGKDLR